MQKTMEQKMSLDSSAPPLLMGPGRPEIRGPPAKEDGGDVPRSRGLDPFPGRGVFAQGGGLGLSRPRGEAEG